MILGEQIPAATSCNFNWVSSLLPSLWGINTLTVLLLNKCFQEMFECRLRGITTSPCYLQTKMMSVLRAPFLLPLVRMNALSWGLSFSYSMGAIFNCPPDSWCPRWIRAWIYAHKLLWNMKTALAAFSSILNAFFVSWFRKELIVSCSASHQWNQLALKKLPLSLPNWILLISGDALNCIGTGFQILVQAGISPVFRAGKSS